MVKRFRQPTGNFFFRLGAVRKVGLLHALLYMFIVLLPVLAACSSQDPPPGTPSSVTPSPTGPLISVDARQTGATIPSSAFGMNVAVWDNNLLDPTAPDLLRRAGITMLRFPGGSTADVYHWKTHSITAGRGYINPRNTFDAYMGVVKQIGAQAFITVNYGSNEAGTDGGDPAEAAAWVYYANITKHYGIKYWEIGNEVYGNGSYSGKWEADMHADKGPVTYANNVLKFVNAMKAVDPSIKVGVAFTTPDINGSERQMADWDPTVLSIACSQIDFVDIHWYPRWQDQKDSPGPDHQLLTSTNNVAGIISLPRSEISQYCGSHARDVEFFLGEVNTGNTGKQSVGLVNTLFLSDIYMSWLENGGSNVSWWDLHNGIETNGDNSPSLYGKGYYGDQGILSTGTCALGQCEPAPNTPFSPYYGLQMLTHLGRPGDQIALASSTVGPVTVHAVKQSNGNLAVLLINKDPGTTFSPTVKLVGYTPASTATVYSFGRESTAISSSSMQVPASAFKQALLPYSITTIVFTPARASIP